MILLKTYKIGTQKTNPISTSKHSSHPLKITIKLKGNPTMINLILCLKDYKQIYKKKKVNLK
jgi:hypothetical protein